MTKTVVLYDGLCNLCQQSVRTIRRLDWRHSFTYMDAQDRDSVSGQFPQLDPAEILGAIHIVAQDGTVYQGFAGMRHIARYLPALMWAYPLLFLPGVTWLGPKFYRWIAAHRYEFNRYIGGPTECAGGTCKLPTA